MENKWAIITLLSKMVLKYQAWQITLTEFVFSYFGIIINNRHNRLSDEHADMLIFLHENE